MNNLTDKYKKIVNETVIDWNFNHEKWLYTQGEKINNWNILKKRNSACTLKQYKSSENSAKSHF